MDNLEKGDVFKIKLIFPNKLRAYDFKIEKERKLIEYRGVSNIFDANDDLQEVRITYSDETPSN
jgi:hypothetical protein